MQRVGVFGASGKMGRTLCAAIGGSSDLELVATIDPAVTSVVEGVAHFADTSSLSPAQVDVVIDFSLPAVARIAVPELLCRSIPVVSGTTGLTEADRSTFAAACATGGVAGLWAANYAIGAVLLMRFAAQAAPYFEAIEVIELHHDQKRDAPSGTALETVASMANARAQRGVAPAIDPTTNVVLDGARGALGEGDIHIHSVRLPGLVAHEEVLFGAPGQTLTLRHDSYDRVSFVAGVLLGVRSIPKLTGFTVGIDTLFDLATA